MNIKLEGFVENNNTLFSAKNISKIDVITDAIEKFNYICEILMKKGEKMYLIIDEYDHFANILISTYKDKIYNDLTHGNGFFRMFLNVVKKMTKDVIERVLLIGVSPVTQDDLTSGFNIMHNLSSDAEFNGMIGFTEIEVREMCTYYKSQDMFDGDIEEVLDEIRPWYNNYCFALDSLNESRLYNSDMVLYFLSTYTRTGKAPSNMLDPNTKTDYDKLRRLVHMDKIFNREIGFENHNTGVIQEIINNGGVSCAINNSFSLHEMVEPHNLKSMLYYLGMLSISGTYRGDAYLSIPNNVRPLQNIHKCLYIHSL